MVNKKRVSKVLVFVLLIGTLLSSVAFAADTKDYVIDKDIKISAKAHIQSFGDRSFETDDKGVLEFGTTGKAKRLEEFALKLEGAPKDMAIEYRVHGQSYGDMPAEADKWIRGDKEIGSRGKAKRIEGIQIRLVNTETGKKYEGYSVEYQVHMQSFGWGVNKTDKGDVWAKDGEFAGTKGLSKRLEAVRVRIKKEDELKVKSVSAINANKISVTFEGIEEAVEIELETALVHGENEVTFEYEGQSFTEKVNYVDPAVVEEEKEEAVKTAIAKINLIGNPATLTLEDEAKVVEARTAVDAATKLGAVDTDIVNLDQLEAAEDVIKGLKETLNAKETAIQEAKVALLKLPLEVTLDNEEQVNDAAVKVAKALELGAEESDFVNLWKLENAQGKIAELKGTKEAEEKLAAAKTAAEEAIAALPTVEEVKVEDKEAVANAKALVEAVKALDAEAVVEGEEVIVELEAKIAELEEEAAKELKVESVSAIDDTSVTVKFEALKDELKEATVEVKDNKGNVVEVKPQDLVKGETVATFIFKTKLEKAPEGVWTVEGIKHDLDLIKNINAFIAATTQTEINKALTDLGIKNVKVENMPLYESEKTDWNKEHKTATVEDIQKFVDDANKKAVEGEADQAEAKKIIEAAKGTNDIVYAEAMKSEELERVNPDWIADYRTDIKTLDEKTAKVEDIQAKIDTKNNTELTKLSAGTELDKAKLNKEKALLENYTKPGKDGKLDDTTLGKIKAYDIQLALADLNTAKTAALFKSYYSKLVTVVDKEADLSMKDFVEDNAEGYVEELKALLAKDPSEPVTSVSDLKTKIITKVNDAVKADVLKSINDVVKADNDKATAEDLLKVLKDAGIKEVIDENKDAYFKARTTFATESAASKKLEDVVKVVTDVNKGVKVDALVKALNEAKTAEEVNAALLGLELVDYINVPSADRLFVAEALLNREDAKKIVIKGSGSEGAAGEGEELLSTVLTAAIEVRTDALGAVNKITKDTKIAGENSVVAALEGIDAEFAKKGLVEKSAVAEVFKASLYNEKGEFVAPAFKTIAAVKAAAGL